MEETTCAMCSGRAIDTNKYWNRRSLLNVTRRHRFPSEVTVMSTSTSQLAIMLIRLL